MEKIPAIEKYKEVLNSLLDTIQRVYLTSTEVHCVDELCMYEYKINIHEVASEYKNLANIFGLYINPNSQDGLYVIINNELLVTFIMPDEFREDVFYRIQRVFRKFTGHVFEVITKKEALDLKKKENKN